MALETLILTLQSRAPIDARLISFVMKGIINEHPQLRKNSVNFMARILVILKERAARDGSLKYDDLKKNTLSTNLMDFKILYSGTAFLDANIGWLCLPVSIKTYNCVVNDDFYIIEKTSIDCHEAIIKNIDDPAFWTSLMEFNSQETSNTIEVFNHRMSHFFKRLFGLVQDKPFKIIAPLLNKLVFKSDHNCSQRAAAELIAGILRGSKHWDPITKKDSLNTIYDLLKNAISKATSESLVYWAECIMFIGVTVLFDSGK